MKKLSCVIAAAFAAVVSGHVLALTPATAPELTLSLSGASAQDQGLVKLIENLCDAGTLDYFSDTGETDKIANYNGYYCSIALSKLTVASPVGNLAARDANADGKLNVLVLKRSAGGSGEGSNGVCNDTGGVQQLVLDNACVDNGTAGDPVSGDRIYRCPTLAVRQSDGGLSDLEVNKLPGSFGTVCASKSVVTNAIWGTVFNTPVSLNLRNALQCAQGLTVGADDEANMPNLPKAVIASIFNGGIASWDRLRAPRVDGTWVSLADAVTDRVSQGLCPGYNVATYPIPTDRRVRACRRVDSSGTNTQFRVKFLNQGCTSEAQPQLADNTPNSNNSTNTFSNWQNVNPPISTAPAMIEASSSSNMNACLGAFADTTAPTTQRWAIGIQSLENNANLASAYRYIKIDGFAPTVKNVLEHKYNDWVESVWIWLTPTTQLNRDLVDLQRVFLDGTGAAADVGLLNNTFVHPFGASGLVALNTITGNTVNQPINLALPVATSSHGGSSCRTPQIRVNTGF